MAIHKAYDCGPQLRYKIGGPFSTWAAAGRASGLRLLLSS